MPSTAHPRSSPWIRPSRRRSACSAPRPRRRRCSGSSSSTRCPTRASRCSSATPTSRRSWHPACHGRWRPVTLQSLLDPGLLRAAGAHRDAHPGTDSRRDRDTSPAEPVLPDLETLLDIGGGRSGIFWPLPGSAGPAIVDTLGQLGSDDLPVADPPPVRHHGAGSGRSHRRRARHDGGAAPVCSCTTREISAALGEASATDESALRGAALTEATAFLTFATRDAGGAPILVSTERGQDRSFVALRGGDRRGRRRARCRDRQPRPALSDASPVERRRGGGGTGAGPGRRGIRPHRRSGPHHGLRQHPRSARAAHRTRAHLDPPAARRRLVCAARASGPPPSRCIASRPSRPSAPSASSRRARSSCSAPRRRCRCGCATTCPIPSTSCSTPNPTIRASSSPRRPRCWRRPTPTRAVQVPVEARVGSGDVVIELRLLSPSGSRDRRDPVGRRDGPCRLGGHRPRRARRAHRGVPDARRRAHGAEPPSGEEGGCRGGAETPPPAAERRVSEHGR